MAFWTTYQIMGTTFFAPFQNAAMVVENVERGTIPHSPAPLEFCSLIETSLLNFYES